MKTGIEAVVVPPDRLKLLTKEVFDALDVSEGTRKEYSVRIRHFITFAEVHGINHGTFLSYKQYLAGIDTFSTSTKNKYLISAKLFLDGLYRLQLIPVKITDNIRGFSQGRMHKRNGLTDADIGRLQEYCSGLPPIQQNIRLRAIIALFLFQGLRQIEVARLDVGDVDLKNKIAHIHGKGRDDKEPVHLHPSTVIVLGEYLRCYRFREGALFRSGSNYSNGSRLTTKSIREIIKQVFGHLQIDGTTHGFRHFFVTKLIKSYKGELLMVSKYSRHRSIQMLEVYNDEVIREQDLPRYYDVFNDITI